ncbi:hypothetical protein NMG60_11026842 [Bertholletia excelsa]
MVLRRLQVRRKGVRVISVAAALAALPWMFIFSGGDGRKGGIIFVEGSTGARSGGLFAIGGGGYWGSGSPFNVGIAVAVTAMAGLALAATVVYARRGSLKSPWSRRRRKHVLLSKQWKSFFDSEGRFYDGGAKFFKKVRSGGVDPSIRAEVWPFLLGVYEVNSSKEERDSVRNEKRKEYEKIQRQCQDIVNGGNKSFKLKETSGNNSGEYSGDCSQVLDNSSLEEVVSAKCSLSAEGSEDPYHQLQSPPLKTSDKLLKEELDESGIICENTSEADSESLDSDLSVETVVAQPCFAREGSGKKIHDDHAAGTPSESQAGFTSHNAEDFSTWQRIIRLDALRANAEWVIYSPSQAAVSETKAQELAESVGLNDYDHLEPCRIFHAARLVAILEAYALYDPEIGYCQGMSDLLSPILSVMEEDFEAFWCFVGFMRKARHNFRLDEVGIRRQLSIVSKIIKCKDSHLYNHLEKLQAEDCFFVYRMVVVLFRRELNFEQTLCLWEVMWADQAAIRAGFARATWGRMRLRVPPTDDLLLYAIAACVLQRRKLIIEKYSSVDEIMRECNSMAGQLDVWKLLDDAQDLVVTLHDKI